MISIIINACDKENKRTDNNYIWVYIEFKILNDLTDIHNSNTWIATYTCIELYLYKECNKHIIVRAGVRESVWAHAYNKKIIIS